MHGVLWKGSNFILDHIVFEILFILLLFQWYNEVTFLLETYLSICWADLRASLVFINLEGIDHFLCTYKNFICVLCWCRFRNLIERALKARLVYGSPHMNRAVSFEYMNRQLVWNEFSVTLIGTIIPLFCFAFFVCPAVYIIKYWTLMTRTWKSDLRFVDGISQEHQSPASFPNSASGP